jgi:hypothetical protein
MSDEVSDTDDASMLPVAVVMAVIVLGAGGWVAIALLAGGGPSPERAEKLGEEAERECILEGTTPDRCPEIVGRYHRTCLQKATRKETSSDAGRLDRETYMTCMRRHFEDADAGAT